MKLVRLTLTDNRPFLIRADLILQVRPYDGGGAEVWFESGTVVVKETLEDIGKRLEGE